MQSAAPARLRINRSAGPPQNRLLHNGALSEVAELALSFSASHPALKIIIDKGLKKHMAGSGVLDT